MRRVERIHVATPHVPRGEHRPGPKSQVIAKEGLSLMSLTEVRWK